MQQVIYSHPTIGQELINAREVINQFINSCSHSLRGPLKSITGVNTILKEAVKNGNEDPLLYIGMIDESVKKLESLLIQFEQFLETSKKSFTMEPVVLDKMVNEVVQSFGKASGVAINVHLDVQDFLYTDHSCIRLILHHLLQNAIVFRDDAKKKKSVSLVIKVTRVSASINVVDNGIGIAPDAQTRIFDLFYRGSEQSTGTGVGLYMVQQVLKKIGGSISFHSEENNGSNFFVWIPNYSC